MDKLEANRQNFGMERAPDWFQEGIGFTVHWTSEAMESATGKIVSNAFGTAVSSVIASVDVFDAIAHGNAKDVYVQSLGSIGNVTGGLVGGLAGAWFGGKAGGPRSAFTMGYISGSALASEGEKLGERFGELSWDIPGTLANWWQSATATIAKRINPVNNVVIPGDRCFPASTIIAISRTESCSISEIQIGDVVLAFDPSADLGRGALVPRRVTRLFRNITTEWLRLTWQEGGEARELVCTPGHHFLDQFGAFPPIEQMIGDEPGKVADFSDQANSRKKLGRATVVLASGELAEVMDRLMKAAGARFVGGAYAF